MNETRTKRLLEIEKIGGEEYLKTKKELIDISNIILNQCLNYFDTAKTDDERDKVFKRYVVINREIPKEDQRNLLNYGIELERNKFKIMSLYEQGKYIQDDLMKYQRQFIFNLSNEIQMIDINKLTPSKHLMN